MKPLQNSKNISDITEKNRIKAYGLPEHGKLAKTYISLTDPKSKISFSAVYAAKGVHIKALPLWRSVFYVLCAFSQIKRPQGIQKETLWSFRALPYAIRQKPLRHYKFVDGVYSTLYPKNSASARSGIYAAPSISCAAVSVSRSLPFIS